MTTKEIIIQGEKFNATVPYVLGHVLTEVEARALNQLRCENLRNNFATRVKDSKEGKEGSLSASQLAEAFAEYDAAYTFASPGTGTGTRKMDPIEREARAIAAEIIKANIEKSGRKVKDVREANPDGYEAKLEEVAANDQVLKLARKRVADKKKVTDELGALLDGGDTAEAA